LRKAEVFEIAKGGMIKMRAMESSDWFLLYTESEKLVTSFPKLDGRETPQSKC
jgi:hypothetical protein